MSRKLIFTLTMMLAMTLSAVAAGHRFTLVIDAGHGGHDGAFAQVKQALGPIPDAAHDGQGGNALLQVRQRAGA